MCLVSKKILFVTDLSFIGSGYMYLSIPLCKGLVEQGYEVKAVGLGNDGSEHDLPFSILPAGNFKVAHAIVHNLHHLDWIPDVVIVALDIPHQEFFIEKFKNLSSKYIAITPLENGPLTMSWAAPLMLADGIFFISELGTQEAHKAGIAKAEHLFIGADTVSWPVPDAVTRNRIRASMELEDKFVVLTVADNQERKNLWAAMDIVSKAKKAGVKHLHYIMVTREHSPVGHKIRDLAVELDINDELTIMERGLSHDILWSMYAASDLFLLTSKAEGLGLPILEAMCCGVPVMATDTGAITELLADDRGFAIPPEYTFTDVWGNSKRDMIDRDYASIEIENIAIDKNDKKGGASYRAKNARKYVEARTWDAPVQQLISKIKELTDG